MSSWRSFSYKSRRVALHTVRDALSLCHLREASAEYHLQEALAKYHLGEASVIGEVRVAE